MIIGTILTLSVVVLIAQEANAAASTSLSLNQIQDSRCSGFAGCSNTGTITLRLGSGGDGPNR